MWAFGAAHRGRRSCNNADCRARYWRNVYGLALGGLEELTASGTEQPKFLTVTLPGQDIKVPVQWFIEEQRRELAKHAQRRQRQWCPIPATCPLTVRYEGRNYAVRDGHVMLPPRGRMAYRYTSMCWNRFITAVRRKLKKAHGSLGVFWYMRVVEEQRRKAPHYHALVYSPFVAQAELSTLAVAAGLGFVLDIRAASPEEHAAYATKLAQYATKTIMSGNPTPKGLRFYTRSQIWAREGREARRTQREEWKRLQQEAGVEWRYVKQTEFQRALTAAAAATGIVVEEATGEIYARAPTASAPAA